MTRVVELVTTGEVKMSRASVHSYVHGSGYGNASPGRQKHLPWCSITAMPAKTQGNGCNRCIGEWEQVSKSGREGRGAQWRWLGQE